jgi:alpha-1,6-mannosyltransferase
MTATRVEAGRARSGTVELALTAACLIGLTATASAVHQAAGWRAHLPIMFACGIGAALAAPVARRAGAREALWIVLGAAVVMRLMALLVEPCTSSDIFRYIWDGRVQAAGINPYRYVATAPELAHLRDTVVYPNINRADYAVSIYPPAAQMVFLLTTRLGESVTVMKLGLLAFEAVTIAAVISLLQVLNRPITDIVAYAWHPLPIWEIAGSGHVDAAMVALFMAGLWVFVRGQTLLAGLLVTIALLALPAFWKPWNWPLPLVFAATVLVFYLPYLSVGWGVFGFLPTYAHEERMTSGEGFWPVTLFEAVAGPFPNAYPIYLGVAAATALALALAAGFSSERTPAATIAWLAWLLIAFLCLLSPDYPWYFLVLTPFVVLTRLLTPWVLTAGAFVLNDAIPGDDALHLMTREWLLYGGAAIAIAFDLWSRCSGTSQDSGARPK